MKLFPVLVTSDGKVDVRWADGDRIHAVDGNGRGIGAGVSVVWRRHNQPGFLGGGVLVARQRGPAGDNQLQARVQPHYHAVEAVEQQQAKRFVPWQRINKKKGERIKLSKILDDGHEVETIFSQLWA